MEYLHFHCLYDQIPERVPVTFEEATVWGMNEIVEKVRELTSGQRTIENPTESASQDIYEHTRLVEALSGNTSVRTFISEIIEEYWETRDGIEDAKNER